ncbi:hypothetical protein BC826DRAFT_905835 [Russula brevipes]|nr:hypothetical protein BC826DRAFT_905835 [Russula brevipes]
MFLFQENAQRKYIDLIKEAVEKWPNWDPPINIHPGDFGTVKTKTGRLLVEGNIYTHGDTKQLASQYPPIQSDEVERYHIQSNKVRRLDIGANVGACRGVPDVQGVDFNTRWQFNKKRGAILLMHKPRLSRVPDAFFKVFESLNIDVLKGKYVVYQAWNCPGYYMYLSNRSSEQVTVSLRANAAIPGNINTSVHLSWFSEGSVGVCQDAYRADAVYTPLFCMRSIRKPRLRRDESGPGEDAEKFRWYEADVPWDNLDDEGVTEPEDTYDNGSDDDDD